MDDWLRQPGAEELLSEMRERQDALISALLSSNTNDAGVISAVRMLQGAELGIEYITSRVAEAHDNLKAAEARAEED